jgi:hypothetical protein
VFDVSPPVLLIRVVLDEGEYGIFVELYLHGKIRHSEKEACPSATLSTTSLTGIGRISKAGLRGERPAADRGMTRRLQIGSLALKCLFLPDGD